MNQETSYCSYARPAQTGPIRWLGPKQAQLLNRTEAVRFGNYACFGPFRQMYYPGDYEMLTNGNQITTWWPMKSREIRSFLALTNN